MIMCIFCVLQELSQWAKNMLPWLVIVLSGLWGFSQLLPPPFQIDMTPARLVCGLFLVGVIFWQRILGPQLSVWQARRSARLRERRWAEAIELQKLRKTAIRRCRNCLNPYRDQNPAGGKFMCSYCGHSSKRPVLDIPGTPGSSGILGHLVGKNGWICNQDWSAEGNGSWAGSPPRYWIASGDDHCQTEKPYSGAVVLTSRLLSSFLLSIRWLCRKAFWVGSSSEDGSSDADKGLSKKGENGGNYHESRGEKARRKAEEKRQARLEKEMLEEEERKQREEVAGLIEERRKLRDEKLEAEREHTRGSHPEKGRESRKESEKRRQERRKEKDKGSSKSNSDGEELEKIVSRENERKRDFDRKSDSERRDFHKTGINKKSESERRDIQKTGIENNKAHISETTLGVKSNANKPRYFDHIGSNFFGKGAQTPAVPVTKPNKPIAGPVDYTSNVNRGEGHTSGSGHLTARQSSNGDDKTAYQRPVNFDQPQINVWKKSWQSLFSRSSAVSPVPDVSVISNPSQNVQLAQMKTQQASPNHPSQNDKPVETSMPFAAYPLINGSFGNNSNPSFGITSSHPLVGDAGQDIISEEAELFEDPCYVPDPVSLLGPVSESLDNFPVDLGSGFVANMKFQASPILGSVSTSADVTHVSKPAPIESPMSRLRLSDEKHRTPGRLSVSPKARDSQGPSPDESNKNERETWQMWDTPLGPDSLGIVGGSANWLLPAGQNKLNQEDIMHPLAHNHITSFAPKENHVYSGTHPNLNTYAGRHQNGGFGTGFSQADLWLQKTVLQKLPGDAEKKCALTHGENITLGKVSCDCPDRAAAGCPFGPPPSDCWSKKDWTVPGVDDAGDRTLSRPCIGGLFSTGPDVQSVWSFNHLK